MAAQAGTSFRAPWGTRLILMTTFSLLLFIGLPVGMMVVGAVVDPGGVYVGAGLLPVFLGIVLLVARACFIKSYLVSANALIVRRPGPDIRLDLSGLQSVAADPNAMSWTCVMPNGGMFSFGGRGCRNRKLGRYTAYATDMKRSVVLRFPDRTVVVTPDDPDGFVAAINAASAPGVR